MAYGGDRVPDARCGQNDDNPLRVMVVVVVAIVLELSQLFYYFQKVGVSLSTAAGQ
jgi:hypothetical protein